MASMLLSRQLTCCLQQNSRLLLFGKGFFLMFSWCVFGKCSLYVGGANSSVNNAGICLVVLNVAKLKEYVLHLR